MTEITRYIKHRRDTAANWQTNNPTLLAGQLGIVSDAGYPYMKIGDGTTAWNSLKAIYKNTTYTPVGNVFLQDFTTLANLSDYTATTPDGSFALSGGFLRATNTSGLAGWGNHLVYNGFGGINSPNFSLEIIVKIITKNATSYGIGMGFRSMNTISSGEGYMVNLSCHTGSPGRLNSYYSTSGTGITTASDFISINVNDIVKIRMTKDKNRITTYAENITTTGVGSVIIQDTLTRERYWPASRNWDITMFKPAIYLVGGTFDIIEMSCNTKLVSGADIIAVGDSLTHGMFINNDDKTWPELLGDVTGKKVYNFAKTSTTTNQWISAMTEIIQYAPKKVYFLLGRNDVSQSVATATSLANYATMIAALTGAGIDYRIISPLPDSGINQTNLAALRSGLQAAYPTKYIDIQSTFDNGSGGLKYRYNYGDVTHYTETTHAEIVKQLLANDTSLWL